MRIRLLVLACLLGAAALYFYSAVAGDGSRGSLRGGLDATAAKDSSKVSEELLSPPNASVERSLDRISAGAESTTESVGALAAELGPAAAVKRAADELVVRVVDGAGAPCPDARVGVKSGTSSTHPRERTDQLGLMRIELGTPPADASENFGVWASADERGLASELIPFTRAEARETSDDRPIEVRLHPGGWLDVTVLESEGGLPVVGARCYPMADEANDVGQYVDSVTTDARGRASLGPLVPGRRAWYVSAPASERNLRGTAEIELGQRTQLEVYLDQGGLPLALHGWVVDENGERRKTGPEHFAERLEIDHPTLWVGPSRSKGRLVHPNANGEFRVHMEPCDQLLVLANNGANGHRYEPASALVPFGTRDHMLRIAARHPKVETRIEVTSRATGEPIPGAQAVLFLEDPMKSGESCITEKPAPGVLVVHHRDQPGLRYVVTKKGYRHAYGDLQFSGEERTLRVFLEEGLASPVTVLDSETLLPVVGAGFRNKAGDVVATSDANGAAFLEGERAAGRLQVTATGYQLRRWYASWPSPLVTLERHSEK